jgi:hypothetical protein
MTARFKGLAVAAAVMSGAGLASAAPAYAAAGPIAAGITITPSTTVVGGQVTVVATATNTGSSPAAVSLGIDNYQYASQRITGVKGYRCTPRNLQRLIYCGTGPLDPGATASITLSLTATAAGTDNFRVYARTTYTTDDTFAYGTLTVS